MLGAATWCGDVMAARECKELGHFNMAAVQQRTVPTSPARQYWCQMSAQGRDGRGGRETQREKTHETSSSGNSFFLSLSPSLFIPLSVNEIRRTLKIFLPSVLRGDDFFGVFVFCFGFLFSLQKREKKGYNYPPWSQGSFQVLVFSPAVERETRFPAEG